MYRYNNLIIKYNTIFKIQLIYITDITEFEKSPQSRIIKQTDKYYTSCYLLFYYTVFKIN